MTPSLGVFLEHDLSQAKRHAICELLFRSGIRDSVPILFQTSDINLEYAREQQHQDALFLPDHGLFDDFKKWHQATDELLTKLSSFKSIQDFQGVLFPNKSKVSPYDLIGISYGLMQRWEELLSDKRDEHERWGFRDSLLWKHKLLSKPVVDWIARCIAETLSVPFMETAQRFVSLTWDVDSNGMWRGKNRLRNLRGIFQQQGLFPSIKAMKDSFGKHDPHLDFESIVTRLDQLKSRSTFFVQTHLHHPIDSYDLRTSTELLRQLRANAVALNHPIGLHTSYASFKKGTESFRAQETVLRKGFAPQSFGSEKMGHRAHYLRHTNSGYQNGDGDLANWSRFDYDTSLGFAGHEGFRLGTAWPVQLTDQFCKSFVTEFPLIAMDATFRYHRKLSPEETLQRVKQLYNSMADTGGVLTLLWHPHNLDPYNWQDWRDLPFRWIEETDVSVPLCEIKHEHLSSRREWASHFFHSA